jgi:MOSC domain-containing protein YiiM
MQVLSVNVAKPIVVPSKDGDVLTGIYKLPIQEPVMARKTNIDGDGQADLRNHGGIDKAVYAFPNEHYDFYQSCLDQQTAEYGYFGENFTVEGMLESEVRIGDQFILGEAVFEVSQPRSPCFKLAIKFGDADVVKIMVDSGKTGFYLRVLKEGMIQAGRVKPVFSNTSALTVAQVHQLMYVDILNVDMLKKSTDSSALSDSWRGQFSSRLNKLGFSEI